MSIPVNVHTSLNFTLFKYHTRANKTDYFHVLIIYIYICMYNIYHNIFTRFSTSSAMG